MVRPSQREEQVKVRCSHVYAVGPILLRVLRLVESQAFYVASAHNCQREEKASFIVPNTFRGRVHQGTKSQREGGIHGREKTSLGTRSQEVANDKRRNHSNAKEKESKDN